MWILPVADWPLMTKKNENTQKCERFVTVVDTRLAVNQYLCP